MPLHPIVISILFHHYKELIQLISEAEQMEEATATTVNNNSSKKKKEGLTIEGEEKEQAEEMLPLQSKLIHFKQNF